MCDIHRRTVLAKAARDDRTLCGLHGGAVVGGPSRRRYPPHAVLSWISLWLWQPGWTANIMSCARGEIVEWCSAARRAVSKGRTRQHALCTDSTATVSDGWAHLFSRLCGEASALLFSSGPRKKSLASLTQAPGRSCTQAHGHACARMSKAWRAG